MKYISFIFFIIILLIIGVNSIEKQKTIIMPAVIYDQHPYFNSNFEPDGEGVLTLNMVKPNLNPVTRKPELNYPSSDIGVNKKGRIVEPNLFQYFFSSNFNPPNFWMKSMGYNYPIEYNITLTYNENTGVYEYSNNAFFPIDYRGLDTLRFLKKYYDGEKYHNYHFTLHASSKFTYQGGEVFRFIGDDDVWVFIDNRLAVDLGGLHTPQEGVVYLDRFNLIRGNTYNFDFFYCERHTTKSTIKISSTIQIFCPVKDYCGVCNGDGTTCCNAKKDCNDNNMCTDDLCPGVDQLKEIPKDGFKAYCKNQPKVNPLINEKCNTRVCNTSTGQWVINSTVRCSDNLDMCEVSIGCDFKVGCQRKSICNSYSNKCYSGKCQQGKCILKKPGDCVQELESSGYEDPCFTYSCENHSGCKKVPKCKQSNPCLNVTCTEGICSRQTLPNNDCCKDKCTLNKCQRGVCNKDDGSCTAVNLESIDDGNKCTIDLCNSTTGIITHTPVLCTGCSKCSPNTGKCIEDDKLCDDFNQCSVDTCGLVNSTHGNCSSSPSTHCDLGSKCKIYTCDRVMGCNSTDRVCPDNGKCQIGYCDEKVGCLFKKRVCKSSAFCLVSECDDNFGCITYDKRCAATDSKCQSGVCINGTSTEEGKCVSIPFDPKPFICNTPAVISTAVIVAIVLCGFVALLSAIFAGRTGYKYYKDSKYNKFTKAHDNPLYESKNQYSNDNPLYTFK